MSLAMRRPLLACGNIEPWSESKDHTWPESASAHKLFILIFLFFAQTSGELLAFWETISLLMIGVSSRGKIITPTPVTPARYELPPVG